jgi:hypothetical protein
MLEKDRNWQSLVEAGSQDLLFRQHVLTRRICFASTTLCEQNLHPPAQSGSFFHIKRYSTRTRHVPEMLPLNVLSSGNLYEVVDVKPLSSHVFEISERTSSFLHFSTA